LFEKARLIQAVDKQGFELIEPEKLRKKISPKIITLFEKWIVKDCELIIQNPMKNDMIYERDREGKVILGLDNQPLKIQKMLLMASYQELHLYMKDNYTGMVLNDSTTLLCKRSLMRMMTKQIKKAGERYKQMCRCQTCIIFKDMYACEKI
jgi:hypothetical protein